MLNLQIGQKVCMADQESSNSTMNEDLDDYIEDKEELNEEYLDLYSGYTVGGGKPFHVYKAKRIRSKQRFFVPETKQKRKYTKRRKRVKLSEDSEKDVEEVNPLDSFDPSDNQSIFSFLKLKKGVIDPTKVPQNKKRKKTNSEEIKEETKDEAPDDTIDNTDITSFMKPKEEIKELTSKAPQKKRLCLITKIGTSPAPSPSSTSSPVPPPSTPSAPSLPRSSHSDIFYILKVPHRPRNPSRLPLQPLSLNAQSPSPSVTSLLDDLFDF